VLVLTRHEGEYLRIDTRDGTIWLGIRLIKDKKVVLKLEAPPSVSILRDELLPAAEQHANQTDPTPHPLPGGGSHNAAAPHQKEKGAST
jgi:sRNA-binding carbon storage regulator CsrA